MKHFLLLLISIIIGLTGVKADEVLIVAEEVLIVADEIPAMEVLAKALKDQEGINSTIVTQVEMPESLDSFQAVIVYIHGKIDAGPEKAFIKYTKDGGKLICLHHTIGQARKKNEFWLPFLGVDLLTEKGVNEGGYKWIEGINLQIVNLAPDHFITTKKVKYDMQVAYKSEAGGTEKLLPGLIFRDTEVYLNHVLLSPRTVLLGFKYQDENGKIWMQDRSAWYMPVGKGWLFYSQLGHTVQDFENPVYARIIINAVIFEE